MTTNAPLDGQGLSSENNLPPGITLTSLIPVLERLGHAVCLENNRYHLKSYISDEAWASLQEFLQSVEELDLTMPDVDQDGNIVADMIYIQLALSLRDPMTFFPLLKRLRVRDVEGSHNLLFLPLVLSRCLESVEVEGINIDAGIVLQSSLARHATETLKRLIIRSPTFFPSHAIIQSCTALENIEFSSSRRISIASYLEPLMSHSVLKEYKLAAGEDVYSGSQTSVTIHAVSARPPLEVIFARNKREELSIHDKVGLCSSAEYLRHIAKCSTLKKFELTTKDGTYFGSATTLTLDTQTTKPLLETISAWKTLDHLGIREQSASKFPKYLEILASLPSLKSFDLSAGGEKYAWVHPSLSITSRTHPPILSYTSIWNLKDVQDIEITDIDNNYHSAEHYFGILLLCPLLKQFTINCKEYHRCQGTIENNLDSQNTPYIARLTLEPSSSSALPIPQLDIHRITLIATKFQDFAHPLAEIASKTSHCLRGLVFPSGNVLPLEPSLFANPWPYLQKLTLPIDPVAEYLSPHHISLPFLKVIAQQCPRLQSLQALIQLPSVQEVFTPPDGFSSCLLSHPLCNLSVGSLEHRLSRSSGKYAMRGYQVYTIDKVPFIGPKLAGEIARYICALFPNVRIRTHKCASHDSWDAVDEMVQLFRSLLSDLPRPSASLLDGTDD